jgi:hypothetical protein
MARRKSNADHITEATPDAPQKQPRTRKTNEQRILKFDEAIARIAERKQAFIERAKVKAQKAKARADAMFAGLPEGE